MIRTAYFWALSHWESDPPPAVPVAAVQPAAVPADPSTLSARAYRTFQNLRSGASNGLSRAWAGTRRFIAVPAIGPAFTRGYEAATNRFSTERLRADLANWLYAGGANPTPQKREAFNRIMQCKQTGATTLNLSDLGLTTLPDCIGTLSHLKELNLSSNALTARSIPMSLDNLSQLETINLDRNQLEEVPPTIALMAVHPSLRSVSIIGNPNLRIPDRMWGQVATLFTSAASQQAGLEARLKVWVDEGGGGGGDRTEAARLMIEAKQNNLTDLNLRNLQLTSLPKCIEMLPLLTRLNLSGNRLNSLPDIMANLAQLTSIDLSRNLFQAVPTSILALPNLQSLPLKDNFTLRIDDAVLRQLNDRHLLDTPENRNALVTAGLVTWENGSTGQELDRRREVTERVLLCIQAIPPQTTLDLSGIGLTELPSCIGLLTHVTNLNLSRNQFASVPACIRSLPLTSLSLNDNPLASIDTILPIRSLTTLNLQNTPLTTLPNNFNDLNLLTNVTLPPEVNKSCTDILFRIPGMRAKDLTDWVNDAASDPKQMQKRDDARQRILACPVGGHLDLSGLGLTTLPNCIGRFGFSEIDLNENKLKFSQNLGEIYYVSNIEKNTWSLSISIFFIAVLVLFTQGLDACLSVWRQQPLPDQPIPGLRVVPPAEPIVAGPPADGAVAAAPALDVLAPMRAAHAVPDPHVAAVAAVQPDLRVQWLAAVTADGLALRDLPPEAKNDPEIVLAAVRQNGLALEHASEFLRDTLEIVLAAVGQNGLALQHAPLFMRERIDVVMAAVEQNGLALQYASDILRNTPEIVFHAIQQNPEAIQFASQRLRDLYQIPAPAPAASHYNPRRAVIRAGISVNPAALSANPIPTLLELTRKIQESNAGEFPRVRYGNGPGIDAGGLTRSLVKDLFDALCRDGQTRLPMAFEDERFIPRIAPNEHLNNLNQKKCYAGIGAICGMALRNHENIQIGNRFHPLVFKLIHSLTKAEIEGLPNLEDEHPLINRAIYTRMLKTYISDKYSNLHFTAEDIDNIVANPPVQTDSLTAKGVDDVADFHTERTNDFAKVFMPTLIIAKSIVQNLGNHADWDAVKGATSKELREKIEGTLTKAQVKAAMRYQGTNADELEAHFTRWIDEETTTTEKLQQFVQTITSLPTLGASFGTPGSNSYLRLHGSNIDQLVYHTCSFSADFPAALARDDYANFIAALESSFGSNGFNAG